MRKHRKPELWKGLTPVLATVMLITVSIAATAAAYTYITQAQEEFGEIFTNDINQKEEVANSDIDIENVFNSSNGFIHMNVRNTGTLTLEVNKSGRKYFILYADGKPVSSSAGKTGKGWKYVDRPQAPANDVLLDPSDLLTINTTLKYPSRGNSKNLKFTGPNKVEDSHPCFNSGEPSC